MQEESRIDLFKVAEIDLTFNCLPDQQRRPIITGPIACYEVFRDNWDMGKIELQEQFKVMLMNRRNQCLGLVNIGTGSTTGCIVDIRLIFATALKANALSIALAHCHPSGNLKPSDADIQLTKKIVEAGKLLDISVVDHIIITKYGYKSFADERIMPL